jgi:RND family efflux transporter MFP subunit
MADPADRIHELKIDRGAPPPPARWPLWLGIVVGAAVLAVAAWWLLGAGTDALVVQTELALAPASGGGDGTVLDASGYVTARRQATVSAETTGKVAEVLVEEGMRVEEGQVVARLDGTHQEAQLALARAQAEAARAALAETEAQLRAARLERDRLRDLAERRMTSEASLDQAEAAYDALAARLETGRENVRVAERAVRVAEEALDDTIIRAPFAGMVVSKNAQPGEMISPISAGGGFTRTGICTIVDMDSLEIEVDVNESFIGRVQPGQRVTAILDSYPDWRIPSEVIAIVPTADRQKATVKVRIGLLEKDERVLRDMGVRVTFHATDSGDADDEPVRGVTITEGALQSDARGDFVWRVTPDGVVERRDVRVGGPHGRGRILVLEGLAAGDRIVRSSPEPLEAGRAVTTDGR